MTRVEYTELVGIAVVAFGLWLLVAGLFGADSALSYATAGVLLVFYGGAVIASANRRHDEGRAE